MTSDRPSSEQPPGSAGQRCDCRIAPGTSSKLNGFYDVTAILAVLWGAAVLSGHDVWPAHGGIVAWSVVSVMLWIVLGGLLQIYDPVAGRQWLDDMGLLSLMVAGEGFALGVGRLLLGEQHVWRGHAR